MQQTQTIADFMNVVRTTIPGALPNNIVLSTLDQGDTNYQLTLNSYFPPQVVFGVYGANATLVVELNNSGSTKTYPLAAATKPVVVVAVPPGTKQFHATLQNVVLAPGSLNAIATSF